MPFSKYQPISLDVAVSAGMGASFSVALVGGQLRYRLRDSARSEEEAVTVDPSPAQWRSFWRSLDRLDAWSWRGDYQPLPEATRTDGISWRVSLSYSDRAGIDCTGYDAYPPDIDFPDFSAEFRTFCRALSRLLGGLEFAWIVAKPRTVRGSQLRIRQWVHDHREQFELELCRQIPSLAEFAVEPGSSINWLAPGPAGEEIRDGLWPKVLPGPSPQQDGFWPAGGPVWDAAGIVGGYGDDGTGIVLVEAKAHVAELLSPRMTSSSYEVDQQRRVALDEAKLAYKVDPSIAWTGTYYQLANRLAFLYYLRAKRRQPAWLINVYFTGERFSSGASEVIGPDSPAGWSEALAQAKVALGLAVDHPLRDFVADVFLPVQPASMSDEDFCDRVRLRCARLIPWGWEEQQALPLAEARTTLASALEADLTGISDSRADDLISAALRIAHERYIETSSGDPDEAVRGETHALSFDDEQRVLARDACQQIETALGGGARARRQEAAYMAAARIAALREQSGANRSVSG